MHVLRMRPWEIGLQPSKEQIFHWREDRSVSQVRCIHIKLSKIFFHFLIWKTILFTIVSKYIFWAALPNTLNNVHHQNFSLILSFNYHSTENSRQKQPPTCGELIFFLTFTYFPTVNRKYNPLKPASPRNPEGPLFPSPKWKYELIKVICRRKKMPAGRHSFVLVEQWNWIILFPERRTPQSTSSLMIRLWRVICGAFEYFIARRGHKRRLFHCYYSLLHK